jgi:catecholate siderophore receptor
MDGPNGRGGAPRVLQSNDGRILVETQIASSFGGSVPGLSNTRFSARQRAGFLTAVSLASLMGATAASGQDSGLELPAIDVTGDQGGGYQSTQQSITRLPTPLKDTPQTINVVPQQVIQEQKAVSMEDALRNVPGITFSAGEGGQQGDSPYIRGFTARGDIFRDGIRDPGWYTRDLFSVDRVEVYKGPSGFAFGRGSTGGAINNVSKLPTGETSKEASVTGTSVGGYRADLDASGKNGNVSGRIAALYQDMPTPTRDNVYTKRWGVAPSVSVPLDDDTKATLSYVYQGEEGVPDYGVPYLPQPSYSASTGAMTAAGYNGNGSAVGPVPVNRSTWYGIATGPLKDIVQTQTHIVTAKIERELGGDFKFTNATRFIDNKRFSRVTAPRGLGDANNAAFTSTSGIGYPVDDMTVARERRERQTNATYLVNQSDLTGKFDTGIVNHTVATGIEFSRETRSQSGNTLCASTATACKTSLVDPASGGTDATGFVPLTSNSTLATNIGAYVSDQMKITKYFELMGSLRFDRFKTTYQIDDGSPELGRTDNMMSYRTGAVFHPTENSSIYVAYGNSYNPSAELSTLSSSPTSTTGVALAPEKNVSSEAGVKVDMLDGKLSLTGAVFHTVKTNMRIPNDPTSGDLTIVLDGEAKVDGIELGVVGKLTDKWQITAGYSYLKSEISKTTNLNELGNQLPNTPPHNFTLWSAYDLSRDWTVGGGATYQAKAYANTGNTAYVPDYWKFDAMAGYKIDKTSSIQLNVCNLTDAYYYAQYYGGHAVPASGRYAALTYRVKW